MIGHLDINNIIEKINISPTLKNPEYYYDIILNNSDIKEPLKSDLLTKLVTNNESLQFIINLSYKSNIRGNLPINTDDVNCYNKDVIWDINAVNLDCWVDASICALLCNNNVKQYLFTELSKVGNSSSEQLLKLLHKLKKLITPEYKLPYPRNHVCCDKYKFELLKLLSINLNTEYIDEKPRILSGGGSEIITNIFNLCNTTKSKYYAINCASLKEIKHPFKDYSDFINYFANEDEDEDEDKDEDEDEDMIPQPDYIDKDDAPTIQPDVIFLEDVKFTKKYNGHPADFTIGGYVLLSGMLGNSNHYAGFSKCEIFTTNYYLYDNWFWCDVAKSNKKSNYPRLVSPSNDYTIVNSQKPWVMFHKFSRDKELVHNFIFLRKDLVLPISTNLIGGANDKHYFQLYKKYKNKYMALKNVGIP